MKFEVSEYGRLHTIIEADCLEDVITILQAKKPYKDYWKHGNMLYDPNNQSRQVWIWEYKTLAELEAI